MWKSWDDEHKHIEFSKTNKCIRNDLDRRSRFLPDSPAAPTVKTLCDAADQGSIPGSGSSSGDGNGDPLQYACLENPMHRGARQAIVHGVAKELDTIEHRRTHINDIYENQNSSYSPGILTRMNTTEIQLAPLNFNNKERISQACR